MTLGDTQRLHLKLITLFLTELHARGYEATAGDAFRDERAFGKFGESGPYGHHKSNHKLKLAHDFNLFKDGKYLSETEDHREMGEYWESLHPQNRWGGRYDDGNHYETLPG